MVDVMKHVGLDYATFGNHEFDYDRTTFDQRLQESRGHFRWISSNVTYRDGTAFPDVPARLTFDVRNATGEVARVGLFGVTLETRKDPDKEYVRYRSPLAAASEQTAAMRGQVDILLALTHLTLDADREIAQEVAGIDLILGGHEHENNQVYRGPAMTPIMKADANARTVYIHRMAFDTRERRLRIRSELRRIDAETPSDPAVARVVRSWHDRAFDALRAQGFQPDQQIGILTAPLDGLEASVRQGATTLTDLIGQALLDTVPDAEIAIYNSGSIRIDDILVPGPMTQYDAFRVLPFGGKLMLVEMSGAELGRVLDVGKKQNKGNGGFLQTRCVEALQDGWTIDGKPLQPARSYKVVLNDFLLTGEEANLQRLKEGAGNLKVLARDAGDLQNVLIEKLRRTYGGAPPVSRRRAPCTA
jgi:5'-nucleotidase / UDP-sugar diphosphatase